MIEATIDSAAIIDKLHNFGPKIRTNVTKTMRQIVIQGQSDIVRDKLHGGTPLFARSGNLSRALQADVEANGDEIVGSIGVDRTAPYGAVHEYGGTFEVREHLMTSRLGKRSIVRAHTITFPERSFLRAWLSENRTDIGAMIDTAAGEAVK